jgi:hypothetical protein
MTALTRFCENKSLKIDCYDGMQDKSIKEMTKGMILDRIEWWKRIHVAYPKVLALMLSCCIFDLFWDFVLIKGGQDNITVSEEMGTTISSTDYSFFITCLLKLLNLRVTLPSYHRLAITHNRCLWRQVKPCNPNIGDDFLLVSKNKFWDIPSQMCVFVHIMIFFRDLATPWRKERRTFRH